MAKIPKDHRDSANLTEFVNFRMNKHYHNRLRELAAERGSFMNTVARIAVMKYIDDLDSNTQT